MVSWSIVELKQKARELLFTNYIGYFLLSLVLVSVEQLQNILNALNRNTEGLSNLQILFPGVSSISIAVVYLMLFIFLGNIILITVRRSILNSINTNNIDFLDIKPKYDKGTYWNLVYIMFMKGVYLSLWSLLLVIPGVIKSYSYSQIPFILAEDPNISIKQALAMSTQMTEGHKLHMFNLDLSFIGWIFIGYLTFGVGILFVYPYVYVTKAFLYKKLKEAN